MPEKQQCRGYGRDCDNELRPSLMDGGLCPECVQIRSRDAQIKHQRTRDPTVEPW